MAKISFRKEALDRLRSPEQLDQAIEIVSAKSWFALVGCVLLLALGILWAFIGHIPVKVDAYGILYFTGRSTEIVAARDGFLTDLFVKQGQAVRQGQLLAYVRNDEIEEELLSSQHPGAHLENLRRERDFISEIRAPFEGIVMETAEFPIASIKAGDTLLILSPLGIRTRDLTGIAFVSLSDGKQVRENMKVEMKLSSNSPEQRGYMLGRVANIDILPSGREAVKSLVKVKGLADVVFKNVGMAPVHVTIAPELNKNSMTGYQWSAQEPRYPVDPGTVFHALITVDENRPIDYVLPIFERLL